MFGGFWMFVSALAILVLALWPARDRAWRGRRSRPWR